MRKYINSLPLIELKKLPYHSWNCLTISLKERDIDIVVHDEQDLEKLIKFLMRRMNSIDGIKDSAEPLIKYIIKYRKISSEHAETVKSELLFESYKKMKILKFRNKLSFMALIKGVTVVELILLGIQKTYR